MCPTLCGSLDCSPSGSSVHGILQARILEWVAISFSKGSEIDLSACALFLPGEFHEQKSLASYSPWGCRVRHDRVTNTFTLQVFSWVPLCPGFVLILLTAAAAKSLQSCPTLCDPIDRSPPGSPVPGILQARTLEWVAISFSNAGK